MLLKKYLHYIKKINDKRYKDRHLMNMRIEELSKGFNITYSDIWKKLSKRSNISQNDVCKTLKSSW